ncbi:MAG: ribosome assembly RNA-binding protein YhbY [Deltaproteobacteria bacterium]|nr:ribosome assembly RNA-binding protein YhbY [Deltaproteobacteria bacterium]
MDAPPLSARQRRYLKGLAQRLEPAVRVGDAGITEAVLRALDEALLHHELVKVRMRQPREKTAMASRLAEASGATLLGLVGHTVVLYRRHPEEPVIELPA